MYHGISQNRQSLFPLYFCTVFPCLPHLRASSILEDFNWAANLVLSVHLIVGVASNCQRSKIAV